jgi:hypothetical protein
MRRAVAAGLLFLLSACSSFQAGRPLDQLPLPVSPQQRIEVWSGGQRFQLRAVTIDADSLHGVRWLDHPDCDSCRIALVRSSVDSVRTLGYDGGETGALALIILPIALLAYFFHALASEGGGS